MKHQSAGKFAETQSQIAFAGNCKGYSADLTTKHKEENMNWMRTIFARWHSDVGVALLMARLRRNT